MAVHRVCAVESWRVDRITEMIMCADLAGADAGLSDVVALVFWTTCRGVYPVEVPQIPAKVRLRSFLREDVVQVVLDVAPTPRSGTVLEAAGKYRRLLEHIEEDLAQHADVKGAQAARERSSSILAAHG